MSKRVKTLAKLEAKKKSASSEAQVEPKSVGVQKDGEGDKGEELDIQSRLAKIPHRLKSKVLYGMEKIFQVVDKMVIAYMDQMEELQMVTSEKKAREAPE